MPLKVVYFEDILREQIRFRYSSDSDSTNILDSKLPRHCLETIRKRHIGTNNLCISDSAAEFYNAQQIDTFELITMIGYTRTEIMRILAAINKKKYDLALLGVGGTGSSFIYWVEKLAALTGRGNVFKTIYLIDDDNLEYQNTLRNPFPLGKTLDLSIKKSQIMRQFINRTAQMDTAFVERIENLLKNEEAGKFLKNKRTLIYGAPDLETRNLMDTLDLNFYAATHRDSEYRLSFRPTVDSDLVVETYGKIDVGVFHMNQLLMTLDFLHHIAYDLDPDGPDIAPNPGEEINRSSIFSLVDQNGVLKTPRIEIKFCPTQFKKYKETIEQREKEEQEAELKENEAEEPTPLETVHEEAEAMTVADAPDPRLVEKEPEEPEEGV